MKAGKAAFAFVVLFALTLISISSSGQNQNEQATPIKVGELTEKQKAHGKIWGQYHTGRKLDASGNRRGEIEPGVFIEPGIPVINPDVPLPSFDDFISHLKCGADAVVTVIIKDKSSQLTANRGKRHIFSF